MRGACCWTKGVLTWLAPPRGARGGPKAGVMRACCCCFSCAAGGGEAIFFGRGGGKKTKKNRNRLRNTMDCSSLMATTDNGSREECITSSATKKRVMEQDIETFPQGSSPKKIMENLGDDSVSSARSSCLPSSEELATFGIEDQVDALTADMKTWSLCGKIILKLALMLLIGRCLSFRQQEDEGEGFWEIGL